MGLPYGDGCGLWCEGSWARDNWACDKGKGEW